MGLLIVLMAVGCDTPQRMNRLEKQNQELQAEVRKDRNVAVYDLQAKCAKDAKVWFNDTWERDKDTVLLDYTNHYNKSANRCYILVEYHHYSYLGNGSWFNNIMLYDVYENSHVGNFSESHAINLKPEFRENTTVLTCDFV
jgi:hypothetical protein